MLRWISNHRLAHASGGNVMYGGGVDGIGVTTGHEQVYLVFYGSQWGTQGTNGLGNVTLSGDPSGEASYVQQLFKGLGTGTDLWSGVMTQYCQGVAFGSVSCPGSAAHVGYPTGGALAGVWVDESSASPSQATGHQLAAEAVSAAAHFGNTTGTANRNAQYVILSPTGTHPDGFNTPSGNFCAWHDYNGDGTLTGGAAVSPYGDIAFTNMPYVTDLGPSCGQRFVNGGGTDDGISIVGGHEYAETITDQNPAGGWLDSGGEEVGDKCAWISPGSAGGSFDLVLPTGTFAMQTTWGNDGNSGGGACEASHAIVTTGGGGGNTVTVTNPGSQTGTVGQAASLQIHASDSATGQTLTYGATGLPAGLSISASTGLITGTPTTAGTASVTVTVRDTTSASGSASFSWTVSNSGVHSLSMTNPGNQTGTTGTAVSLQIHANDSLSQTLTYGATGLPAGLAISTSTGLITGTPSTAGTTSVTTTARDTSGLTASATFTWTISNPAGNRVTVTSPGNQTGTTGTAVSLQIHASDSASGQTLTYTATGLPAGLSISTSGLITGTPATATTASVTVRATDRTSAFGTAAFTWTITASSSCPAAQLLGNPGFETGSITPWTATPGVLSNIGEGIPVHSGAWAAWLDGYTSPHTDTLSQTVTIPAGCHTATFSFWLDIQSNDPANQAYDTLKVQVLSSGGAVLATLGTYSNLNTGGGYIQRSFSLAPYIGQRITLLFTGAQTLNRYHTSFFDDDNALTVS